MIRLAVFCHLLLCGALLAQGTSPASNPTRSSSTGPTNTAASSQPAGNVNRTHYHPDRFAGRAGTYYRLIWGVDALSVKWAEAGEVIRFSYQVIDAGKAKVLNDKKIEPSLIDEQAHVKLTVPMMDK